MNNDIQEEVEQIRQLLGEAKEHIFNILSNANIEEQDFYDLSYNYFTFSYLINNAIKNIAEQNREYKEMYTAMCLAFLDF